MESVRYWRQVTGKLIQSPMVRLLDQAKLLEIAMDKVKLVKKEEQGQLALKEY